MVVDSHVQVITQLLGPFEQGSLVADMLTERRNRLYHLFGDWFMALASISMDLGALVLVLSAAKKILFTVDRRRDGQKMV